MRFTGINLFNAGCAGFILSLLVTRIVIGAADIGTILLYLLLAGLNIGVIFLPDTKGDVHEE